MINVVLTQSLLHLQVVQIGIFELEGFVLFICLVVLNVAFMEEVLALLQKWFLLDPRLGVIHLTDFRYLFRQIQSPAVVVNAERGIVNARYLEIRGE